MSFIDKIPHLHGIWVVDYEYGAQVGKVQDIFIDRNARKVSAISYKPKQPGTAETHYVETGDRDEPR
jgi:sporulation protein YlmC with PRC-barrel domain